MLCLMIISLNFFNLCVKTLNDTHCKTDEVVYKFPRLKKFRLISKKKFRLINVIFTQVYSLLLLITF